MKKIYKCKVCGYLMEKNAPPEVCPACGFKGKIFEKYESPLSNKRRKVLDIHAHPIIVHVPIAFSASMFLISLLTIMNIVHEKSVFVNMLRAMVLVLPFAAIIAASSGIFDGKLRFKKISTPHLKIKLTLAGLFFVFSFSLFFTQYFLYPDLSFNNIIYLIFSSVLLILAGFLGFIGGRLIESKVRG